MFINSHQNIPAVHCEYSDCYYYWLHHTKALQHIGEITTKSIYECMTYKEAKYTVEAVTVEQIVFKICFDKM